MNKPFVPQAPERMIEMEVSGREANLIDILRIYPFGKFIVLKRYNRLLRIEIKKSELIKEEKGLDLAIK